MRRQRFAIASLVGLVSIAAFSPGSAASAGAESSPPVVTRQDDNAITAGIRWLVRHQEPEGHWVVTAPHPRCAEENPCPVDKKLKPGSRSSSSGTPDPVLTTSLVLWAHLGNATTHKDGMEREFRESVAKAMRWLLAHQVDDPSDPDRHGLLVGDPKGKRREDQLLVHAFATQALAELLALSSDRDALKEPVERALRLCLRAQIEDSGWSRRGRGTRPDGPTTAAVVLALKAGASCALMRQVEIDKKEIDSALETARAWSDSATHVSTGVVKVLGKRHSEAESLLWTASSAAIHTFTGGSRESTLQRARTKRIMEALPESDAGDAAAAAVDPYFAYLASHVAFQASAEEWERCVEGTVYPLVSSQSTESCADGSWAPTDTAVLSTDRVTTTALRVMTLGVTMRYARAR